MAVWIIRGLGVVGAIAFAAGLVNIVVPEMAFPSGTTCITDYDLVVCNIATWAAAPWLALAGGLAVAIAGRILLERQDSTGPNGA
jgi:hypothetical protein